MFVRRGEVILTGSSGILSGADRNTRYLAYTARHLERLAKRGGLPQPDLTAMRAVAMILPFRTNNDVVDELIDWTNVPAYPMYRLVFPQPDMLPESDLSRIVQLLLDQAPPEQLNE